MEIEYQENLKESTKVILHEDLNKLYLNGAITNDNYLEITFPFKITKVPPPLRDVDKVSEYVFVFRNKYFSEYDICEVRKNDGGLKRMGLLFKPNIIFEKDSDFLYNDDKILQTTIFRSIVCLLTDNTSLKANPLKVAREIDFTLGDFFPKDIVVGVFPHEWNPIFQNAEITELLFNLYLNGFYLLKQKGDENFQPPDILLQKDTLNLLPYHRSSYRRYLDIKAMSTKVKENTYCNYYIKELIKQNKNEISKFHQIYGLVEIFKDVVLKHEINEKLCLKPILVSDITGNKLQNDVLEISRDSYCVNKLFTKYSTGSEDNLETLFLEIFYFLESCRDKNEFDILKNFPQLYYYLRNIIVHDIQFLFAGDEESSYETRVELSRIVLKIEYVIIETLRSLKL